MSLHPDDTDDLPRSPDEAASPEEEARARAFAELVDGMVARRPLPEHADGSADLGADDDARSLLHAASLLRAHLGPAEPALPDMSALINDVLGRAPDSRPGRAPLPNGDIIDLSARRAGRRGRLERYAPWALSAVAAAAALVFALRTPALVERPAQPDIQVSQLSMTHRSRPADALVGQIPRARADRASDRMDIIYADRMAGYRDLTLRGGRP